MAFGQSVILCFVLILFLSNLFPPIHLILLNCFRKQGADQIFLIFFFLTLKLNVKHDGMFILIFLLTLLQRVIAKTRC